MILQKLKELCSKAAPGPWQLSTILNGEDQCAEKLVRDKNGDLVVDCCSSPIIQAMDDAEFIAGARTALPILIEVVEKQREALNKIQNSDNELSRWATRAIRDCDELLKELE